MKPWYPPKSIFDDAATLRDWILSPFSLADQTRFIQFEQQENKHGQSCYQALDTSIMDIADDIAYGVHDLEDAIAMEMISHELWQTEVMSQSVFKDCPLFDATQITQWLFAGNSRSRKRGISHLVGAFINATVLTEITAFEHPLLRCQVNLMPEAAAALAVLKQFVWNYVISIPEVKSFEYKGQVMVMELFEVLWANPERLLPRSRVEKMEQAESEHERMRLLCDYVAGMTDDYAKRVYAKLFSPYYGSIFDRL
jgi:dGTPase